MTSGTINEDNSQYSELQSLQSLGESHVSSSDACDCFGGSLVAGEYQCQPDGSYLIPVLPQYQSTCPVDPGTSIEYHGDYFLVLQPGGSGTARGQLWLSDTVRSCIVDVSVALSAPNGPCGEASSSGVGQTSSMSLSLSQDSHVELSQSHGSIIWSSVESVPPSSGGGTYNPSGGGGTSGGGSSNDNQSSSDGGTSGSSFDLSASDFSGSESFSFSFSSPLSSSSGGGVSSSGGIATSTNISSSGGGTSQGNSGTSQSEFSNSAGSNSGSNGSNMVSESGNSNPNCPSVTLSSTLLGWNATTQKYEYVVTAHFSNAAVGQAYTLAWNAGTLVQTVTIVAPQASFSVDLNLVGINGLSANTIRSVTLTPSENPSGGEEACTFEPVTLSLTAPTAPVNPCEEGGDCIPASLLLQVHPFGEGDAFHAPFKTQLFASHAGTVHLNWGDGQEEWVSITAWATVERSHSFTSSGNFTISATLDPTLTGLCNDTQTFVVNVELLDDESSESGGGSEGEPQQGPCQLQVQWLAPTTGANLNGLATLRVQLTDPGELTNPCAANYNRYCNALPPDVRFVLRSETGEYAVTGLEWVRQSGTPRNGIWRTTFDTRDYANGPHTLVVSARGVGCCRVEAMLSVSFSNTLGGSIFYRDTRAEVDEGLVVPDAMIGVEVRALEENPRRRYWVQHGVRSDITPHGPYHHDDWDKHQLVTLQGGASWDAQGMRIERTNYAAHVTLRLPHQPIIYVREKWTPEYTLAAFTTGAQRIRKIRRISEGKHLVFTQNPAKAFVYNGETLELIFDGTAQNASDAQDAALAGDQLLLVLGDTLLAADTDAGQVTAQYTIWNEPRPPRWVETVGSGTSARAIAIYVGEAEQEFPSCAYDLSFSARKPVWTLPSQVTLTAVGQDGSLLVACGAQLRISTDGTASPQAIHTFPAPITALAKDYVGLANGELWRYFSTGWKQVFERTAPIGAIAVWAGGTSGEVANEAARGIAGGTSDWLWGETPDGRWLDERQLHPPLELSSALVERINALDLFSQASLTTSPGDATATPSNDERLLIGTANDGLLFVYQRSALSRAQGAILVSHDITQRIFPFGRRKVEES